MAEEKKQKESMDRGAVDKLTELYIKLEQIQGYVRKIEGRMKRYTQELDAVRKKRSQQESEMISGIKAKKAVLSDRTI